jgi:type IV secretion system protein VirD4
MSSRRSASISNGLALALIGASIALYGILWLWGGVAGALLGRGWATLRPAQALGVALALPRHLGNPAAAWPPADRPLLPSPAGVYLALGILIAALTALLALALRAVPCVLGREPGEGARWARRADLVSLHAPRIGRARRIRHAPRIPHAPRIRRRPRSRGTRPAGGSAAGESSARIVLGRHGRRRLATESRHALIAFGPPQSGKSSGLAIPALLDWNGPAVASSIKTDLLAATVARRRRLGPVYVFDPFELSGIASDTWSPLQQATTWDGALEVAWRLASAGETDQRSVEGGDFWAVAAEQRLAPLLFAASRSGGGIERLVRWTYGQGARELDETIAQLAGGAADDSQLADAHAAFDAIRAFESQADRTRSSIEATAQALLRAYRFKRVARASRSSQITAERILDEAATLYLVGDAKASKLLAPLFVALLGEIVDCAYERATRAGGRLAPPLLLCLDEAGNVAPLPNLAEVASTAPSHNIQLVSIFHDLAQARSRYGRQAETVVNAHRARMLLAGVADLETLRYFSGLVGEEEARELTRTTGAGGTTRAYGRRRRPLAAAESLRQLPQGHALLLYGHLPPVRVALCMWFSDRRLRRLAAADDGEDDQ